MSIDLAGLTLGLGAAAPGTKLPAAAAGSQVGKRTADSPFAVLLASAVPGRWSEETGATEGGQAGAAPALVTLGRGSAPARLPGAGRAPRTARKVEPERSASDTTGDALHVQVSTDGEPALSEASAEGAAPPATLAQPAPPAVAELTLEPSVAAGPGAVESTHRTAEAPSPASAGEGAVLTAQASLAALQQAARTLPAPRPAGGDTLTLRHLEATPAPGARPLARTGGPVARSAPAGSADPAGLADAVATRRVPSNAAAERPSPRFEPLAQGAGGVRAVPAPRPQDGVPVRQAISTPAAVAPGAPPTQPSAVSSPGTVRAQAKVQDGNVTTQPAKTMSQDQTSGHRGAVAAAPSPQVLPGVRTSAPPPQVQPGVRTSAPQPEVQPSVGASAPQPQVQATTGTFSPPAQVRPSAGAPAPQPQPSARAGSTPPVVRSIEASAAAQPVALARTPVATAAPALPPAATPAKVASRPASSPGPAVQVAAPAASTTTEPTLEQTRADAKASRRDEASRRPSEPVAVPRRGTAAERPAAPASRQAAAPEAAPRPPATSFAARDLTTSARLTQASRAGQPLTEAGEPQRARTSRPAGEPLPQPIGPLQAQATVAEPSTPKAAAPAHRPAPAVQEPPQPGLTGTILPGGAHLRLESETLGDLALHLRIRDGVAHLRVEGEQASALAGHGHELQRALAAEGLQLGKLELDRPQPQAPQPAEASRGPSDQSLAQGQRERPEQDEAGGAASRGASPTTSPQGRRPQGRTTAHHVEA